METTFLHTAGKRVDRRREMRSDDKNLQKHPLCTKANSALLAQILFTDFCQTHDKTINDNIDKILLESNNLYKNQSDDTTSSK